jgi:DNA-binding transcriptional MerR regulator
MDALHVTQIARAAGVTPDAVRHYTRIGLLRPGRDKDNGYKLYRRADVSRLQFISRAKTLGYTLEEIRHILEAADHGDSPCPMVRDIIRRRIEENRLALDAALGLQRRMECALRRWATMPDGVPTGTSICHLIEEVTAGSGRL